METNDLKECVIRLTQIVETQQESIKDHESRLRSIEHKPAKWVDAIISAVIAVVISIVFSLIIK